MLLLIFVSIFPVWWMVVTSFRTETQIFDPRPWPSSFDLSSYSYVLRATPILRMIANTTVVSVTVAAMQVLTGLLAAYAFVRWPSRAMQWAYAAVALSWLVPFQVTMLPNYVSLTKLGLLDTLAGLAVPHLAAAFAVLMLTSTMRSFPADVLDAARIDGASDGQILWRVIVPNLRASITALFILAFVSQWNDYFWPLLLSRSPENSVVQIGLQMFMTQEGNQWGPLMAASTMVSIPVLALYLVLQRQVIDAFMRSGLR